MKKVISLILSAIMAVSALVVTAMPAFAAGTVKSPTATTAASKKPTLEVNGKVTTTDINYTPDADNSNKITFVYTGDGILVGWEENLEELGLVEGTDYTVTYNEDGSLTIDFISDAAIDFWNNGEVAVNALVEFENETTTGKSNGSNKSPTTGAAASAVAASVALAGAGFAVLAASKKKDAE